MIISCCLIQHKHDNIIQSLKDNHFLLSEPHGENGYSSIKRDFDDTIPNLGREGNTVPDLISSTQG